MSINSRMDIDEKLEAKHLFDLGYSYLKLGQKNKANPYFWKAEVKSMITKEDLVECYILIADAYFDTKNYEEAIEYFKKAFKIDPTNLEVLSKLKELYNWYTNEYKDSIFEIQSIEIQLGSNIYELIDDLKRSLHIMKSDFKKDDYILPKVSIVNSAKKTNSYTILLNNICVGMMELNTNKLLAIDNYKPKNNLNLNPHKIIEPVYNHDAYWIEPSDKERLKQDYEIVDCTQIISHHLGQIINRDKYRIAESIKKTINLYKKDKLI